jgi:hypothetical protein
MLTAILAPGYPESGHTCQLQLIRFSECEGLSPLHGAPLRLHNERELGFKHVKWVEAVEFVESFPHLGAGQGGYNEDHEFYGYRESI